MTFPLDFVLLIRTRDRGDLNHGSDSEDRNTWRDSRDLGKIDKLKLFIGWGSEETGV